MVFMTTVLIIINYFIIYVDIVYLYTRAAKEIKIQLYTQPFKLYCSATITERAQKNQSINQYTNTSILIKLYIRKTFSNIITQISILIKQI